LLVANKTQTETYRQSNKRAIESWRCCCS